ncbi:antitoxin VbhA family protein [Paenalcaligenes sp. Me131]|uniref:antitoxin VbhA family protein n=1 Tax=Paenalcaligenes sp. Me131 TaxID=3392636 RepID=UPI003D2B478F
MSSNQIERRAAAESALASVRLEGFSVPEDTLVESERYISGEIDFQEFINRLYQQAKKEG